MPFSDNEGKDVINEWVKSFASDVTTVLDIGCGAGTYFKLFGKNKGGRVLRNASWIGIEAWEPYVEKYKLKEKYTTLFVEDVRLFDFNKINFIDLAFAGDVLEHMSKEDAVITVNRLFKNCKRLIISIPIIYYPQDELENNPFEVHVKDDYTHQEIMETFSNITKFWTGNTIGVYLLEK